VDVVIRGTLKVGTSIVKGVRLGTRRREQKIIKGPWSRKPP